MKTQVQLRTEIYNALIANTTLPDRVYWIARPTVNNVFPLLIYNVLDTSSDYAFGTGSSQSEAFDVQIDIYTDPDDVTSMDSYVNAVKTTMEAINYRNIGSPVEFYESDINKVVRPTRWERLNV